MRHAVAVWSLLATTTFAQVFAQTHFTKPWSGTPYLAMNVYVPSASCDGMAVGDGDEIGVFDGPLCVGASSLSGPILAGVPLSIVISMDDPLTPAPDGFITGHMLSWRIWKRTEGYEYQDSSIGRTFALGDGTFSPQGTAMASLTGSGIPFLLSDFRASLQNQNSVVLSWTTLSERRNQGFQLQRSGDSTGGFVSIPGGFVPGHGTTSQPYSYTFTAGPTPTGVWYYRLEQLDSSGISHFTHPVRVTIVADVPGTALPPQCALFQNYPNPFNPTTVIRCQWPVTSVVKLAVFDLLGREIALLADGVYPAGQHTFTFSSHGLAGGMYMYRLLARPHTGGEDPPFSAGEARTFADTRMMVFIQ